jgi:hypothetical protein
VRRSVKWHPKARARHGTRAGEPSEARSVCESSAMGTSGPTRRRCWRAKSVLGGARTAAQAKSSCSRGRGLWRLGGKSEVREDLAHDDWVGERCERESRSSELRSGQRVEGDDASQELGSC